MKLYQFGHPISFRVQNLVSKYHKLFPRASSPPALPNLHGHTRAYNSEADNSGNSKTPRWEACAQVFKTSSSCLPKKEQPAPSQGLPSMLNGSKPFPPTPAQTAQPSHCFLLPREQKVGFVSSVSECFCIIKLLHSFPP